MEESETVFELKRIIQCKFDSSPEEYDLHEAHLHDYLSECAAENALFDIAVELIVLLDNIERDDLMCTCAIEEVCALLPKDTVKNLRSMGKAQSTRNVLGKCVKDKWNHPSREDDYLADYSDWRQEKWLEEEQEKAEEYEETFGISIEE